ncbi:MAG: FAD-dependent oxidoreductase [Oscillospiraceae bacterium]|jgi:flavorubredoxin/NADPH-dependent 2,4-dienoyl-CoA reductase/sulfur reductase-like enzyme|nr:FAD-dependent oxidoreductase [Oscillospiraceae bacterium]
MNLPLKLTDDLYYLGVSDAELRTFDVIMTTEFGTTYNAYVLKTGAKSVLFETAKASFFDEYLKNLQKVTDINDVEYLVVSHTEPDHAGSVERLLELRPDLKIVASSAAIGFLKQIVNRDFVGIAIREGQEIAVGSKTLQFYSVPNLHWPDTIYTYIPEESALVTCDSFGSHYAADGALRSTLTDAEADDYLRAAKYYFDCILGPFKPHMQKAISKIENLPLKFILPGHGPVLDSHIPELLDVYRGWSELPPPNAKPTVVIPYVTAYGYTETLANKIARGIADAGDIDVRVRNLTGTGAAESAAVAAELALADGFLLGTPTILGDALEPIWSLTLTMFPGTHGGKLAGAFGSYGWTGEGVPNITERLKQLKLNVADGFRVRFKPGGAELNDAYEYGYDFGCRLLRLDNPRKRGVRQLVKCLVCGEIFDSSLDVCPVCGVGAENFVKVEDGAVPDVKTSLDRYVIVGGGAAALAALKEIRRRDKTGRVTLISEEPYPPYSRPMLTKSMAAGINPEQLLLEDAEFYSGAELRLNERVAAIDVARKTVKSGGENLPYDKLIIATGAECFVPPFPGREKRGVHTIRRIADTEKIYAELPNVKQAVVIGGGVLGLEAAWELSKLGHAVTVIQSSAYLLNKQLDEESSARLLGIAEAKGVSVLTNAEVAEITGDGSVAGVTLADGRRLVAQLVIISTGVRANAELAKSAGIETGRAVTVDEHMRTSAPDVFAAGDCAEYNGDNLALWSEASDQGRIAGASAAGGDDTYVPAGSAVTFNGFGSALYAVGDAGKNENHSYKTVTVSEKDTGRYKKLFFLNGKLQGAVIIGAGTNTAEITEQVQNRAKFSDVTL